jgi:glycosyltransferase involved in cell wall biosynthesis
MTDARPKVLYVAESADPAGSAGVLLRPRLDPSKFAQVVIFPGEPGPEALRFQHAGIVVHSLGLPMSPDERSFASSTLAVRRLAKVMEEFGADVAHGLDGASAVLAALAGRIAGVPVLIGTLRRHASRRPSWAVRRILRALDHVVVPSEALSLEIGRHLGGKHPPIAVIPDAVDAGSVRSFARAPDFSEPKLRVGTSLHVTRDSGIDAVIGAARLLRDRFEDFEWLVSGTGPEALRALRSLQGEGLDACVRMLGEREDIGPFLASLDAYVAPATSDAVPCGLLEALVAGLPCIAVRNPTVDAMLAAGRDALVLESGGAEALADAVGRLLAPNGGDLRKTLRGAAARLAAAHAPAVVIPAVLSLYSSAIERARERSG